MPHRNGRREQILHVAFAAIELAMHEERLEAACRESIGQRDRLDRRAADVQPRDDSKNAHRENCTTPNTRAGRTWWDTRVFSLSAGTSLKNYDIVAMQLFGPAPDAARRRTEVPAV
jgi:hypothetical protein